MKEQEIKQKAVLVCADMDQFDVEVSLRELAELCETAGCEVLAQVVQKREKPDNTYFVGQGKLEEIKALCESLDAEVLIFDHELTPSQLRNVEDFTGMDTIDRTMLILDIFAQRAVSREGMLQVELAQCRYSLPRLIGKGKELSRLGGGVGTRGPGESKLESDRRHISRRINALSRELAELKERRARQQERRSKNEVQSIAVVGYTNVGKSTLFNALTSAGVLSENKLFATLDPTARELTLPSGKRVVLVDTVGFLDRLPHSLVEAFQSTLEQAVYADLILNLIDISSPDAHRQNQVTLDLLEELGCKLDRVLTICNKCDLIEGEPPAPLRADTLYLSAKTGFGFDHLLHKVEEMLDAGSTDETYLIPFTEYDALFLVRENSVIKSEEYTEDGVLIHARVDAATAGRMRSFLFPKN